MRIQNDLESSPILAIVISQPENDYQKSTIVPTFSIERHDGASTRFLMEDIVNFLEDAKANNLLSKSVIDNIIKEVKGLKENSLLAKKLAKKQYQYTPQSGISTKESNPSFRYSNESDWVKTNTQEAHPVYGLGMIQPQTSYTASAVNLDNSTKKRNATPVIQKRDSGHKL